nr:uncharacterized protein LOC117680754 isoform X5 [Crassostrea gigas]
MKIRFIIFLVFTKCQTVASQSKLVVHTTCLELAKSSNQHLRMTCSNSTEYHCLLDETFTKEFEVCKKWKWISKGYCAYFNTYGEGNIDQNQCNDSTHLVCPESAYFSKENTNYPACYVKNTTSTVSPKTSTFEVTLEGTTEVTSEFRNSIGSPISDTAKSKSGITGMTIAIVFGVIILFLLPLAVIYIFCKKREIDELPCELELIRTGESQVHHQENQNVSTGENVKPDEEGCIELTSDDANLPQTVSATINAKEPGKTVTA